MVFSVDRMIEVIDIGMISENGGVVEKVGEGVRKIGLSFAGRWTPVELDTSFLPIDIWVMGAQLSHSNNHIFAANVGDEKPFMRSVFLVVAKELDAMSYSGGVESIVGIVGIGVSEPLYSSAPNVL